MKRGRPDYFSRRARAEGYASRAAYKLMDLQRRFKVLRLGHRVLELGAAPGGWTRYVLETVRATGSVVAVDLQPLDLRAANLQVVQGDFRSAEVRDRLATAAPFNAILSDAAPATTGNRLVDTAASAALVAAVLELADLMVNHGRLAIKVFQGEGFPELLASARARFPGLRVAKPSASRSESMEVYLVV